jgi:CBS domain-containing protein
MNEEIIREEEIIALEQAEEAAQFSTALIRRPIRALPTLKPPITVRRRTSVRDAVEAMNRGRVGCVLVVDGAALAGVFTERDVLTKVVSRGVDPDQTAIERVMTEDPETLTLDDGIVYALNKMSVGGFRHIPLVDEQNRPTGVVAMRNIVDYLVHLYPTQVLNLPPSPSLGIARAREGA